MPPVTTSPLTCWSVSVMVCVSCCICGCPYEGVIDAMDAMGIIMWFCDAPPIIALGEPMPMCGIMPGDIGEMWLEGPCAGGCRGGGRSQ